MGDTIRNMVRATLSLDEREYELVKERAAALGIPVSEFIRRAIREQLPAIQEGPWMRYAGYVETGDPDSSASTDELAYGLKP